MTQPVAHGRFRGQPADLYVSGNGAVDGRDAIVSVAFFEDAPVSRHLGRIGMTIHDARSLAAALTTTCDALDAVAEDQT